MTAIPKGIWKYALLLLLLLAIAAVATISTISTIQSMLVEASQKVGPRSYEAIGRIITIAILALTMGFLLLAGALGLWAIRSTTQTEARRRLGRFVDAMDYLSDGLLAFDRKGLITGSNPAARSLVMAPIGLAATLKELFPSLTDDDIRLLHDRGSPQEVERACKTPQGFRALRFRSQPTEDLNLILLSDVTEQRTTEMQTRQIAQLQLIGRVARGVAHDFNNILCAISAHASLLGRTEAGAPQERESLQAILRESERGAILARHLLELSRTGVKGPPCERLPEHLQQAAGLLRVGLSTGWEVRVDVEGAFAPVALTSVQLEQVILNLGLLAADERGDSGLLHIRAGVPGTRPPFNSAEPFEALVIVAAHDKAAAISEDAFRVSDKPTSGDSGVIQSVVRSMLEEMGGRLEPLFAPGGRHGYRIGLPGLQQAPEAAAVLLNLPEPLKSFVSGWPILVAASSAEFRDRLESHLKELGLSVLTADTLVGALQYVQSDRQFSAMILERQLFGNEAQALLRAILKLQPSTALLVVSNETTDAPGPLARDVAFVPTTATSEDILQSLVRAKTLAEGRKKNQPGNPPG